jgi:hypothetical protein
MLISVNYAECSNMDFSSYFFSTRINGEKEPRNGREKSFLARAFHLKYDSEH